MACAESDGRDAERVHVPRLSDSLSASSPCMSDLSPKSFLYCDRYWTIGEEGATPEGSDKPLWFTRELVAALADPPASLTEI